MTICQHFIDGIIGFVIFYRWSICSLDFLKEYLDARVLLVTSRYTVNTLRKLVIYSRIDAPSFL
jgi:hypothetical protein